MPEQYIVKIVVEVMLHSVSECIKLRIAPANPTCGEKINVS